MYQVSYIIVKVLMKPYINPTSQKSKTRKSSASLLKPSILQHLPGFGFRV